MEKVIRECGCPKHTKWTQIPEDALLFLEGDLSDGFYWDCPCGSTMWLKISKVPLTGEDLEYIRKTVRDEQKSRRGTIPMPVLLGLGETIARNLHFNSEEPPVRQHA